jgi:hypothetical protein
VEFIAVHVITPLNQKTHLRYATVLKRLLAPYRVIQCEEDAASRIREEETRRRCEENRRQFETNFEARQRTESCEREWRESFQAQQQGFCGASQERPFAGEHARYHQPFFPRIMNGVIAQRELERVFGRPITTERSLIKAYREWALRNHPDRFAGNQQAEIEATALFQNVSVWMDQLKAFKGWAS